MSCVAMGIVFSEKTLQTLRERYNRLMSDVLTEEELKETTDRELLENLLLYFEPRDGLEEVDLRKSIYHWEEY